jgi:hypothetical protein
LRLGKDTVNSFSDWIHWVFPLGIALTILWNGRRRPTTVNMAVGWTVAEIYGAVEFQAGFRWCAIVGVTAVAASCLPGLRRFLAEPVPTLSTIAPVGAPLR